MPVLPAEPALFPENLFDEAERASVLGRSWLVVHTKPRAEKSLARNLHKMAVPYFLPLYARRLASRKRLRFSYVPLFPGYVFIYGDDAHDRHSLFADHVVRVLPVGDQEQIYRELYRVHRLMESGASLAPEERLQPGMSVEIVSGPLKGMEGKIIRRNHKNLFLVEIDFLKRGASVEVDGWAIRMLH